MIYAINKFRQKLAVFRRCRLSGVGNSEWRAAADHWPFRWPDLLL